MQQLAAAATFAVMGASAANATGLNAGFVLDEMNGDQRVSYISGIVHGLAYSRFLDDRPNEDSMNCILDWHKNLGEDGKLQMEAWFRRHADKPVGPLLYVLIKKECGE